jgi:hypothetical protein
MGRIEMCVQVESGLNHMPAKDMIKDTLQTTFQTSEFLTHTVFGAVEAAAATRRRPCACR